MPSLAAVHHCTDSTRVNRAQECANGIRSVRDRQQPREGSMYTDRHHHHRLSAALPIFGAESKVSECNRSCADDDDD